MVVFVQAYVSCNFLQQVQHMKNSDKKKNFAQIIITNKSVKHGKKWPEVGKNQKCTLTQVCAQNFLYKTN